MSSRTTVCLWNMLDIWYHRLKCTELKSILHFALERYLMSRELFGKVIDCRIVLLLLLLLF